MAIFLIKVMFSDITALMALKPASAVLTTAPMAGLTAEISLMIAVAGSPPAAIASLMLAMCSLNWSTYSPAVSKMPDTSKALLMISPIPARLF